MLSASGWPVHPELPRSVQGGRVCVCSAAVIQNCCLDASDGAAYRCLPPRFICGDQEGLQLQEQYGTGYARPLIEQLKDGFANYCVSQSFVLVSVHGDLLAVKVVPIGQAKPTGYVKAAATTGKGHKKVVVRYIFKMSA